MMYQQGMGMPFGAIPKVPSQQDLWKNEKSKYRQWIFLLMALLVGVLILMTISLSLGVASKATLVDDAFEKWLADNDGKSIDGIRADISLSYTYQLIVQPSIYLGAVFIGLVTYIQSVYISYKNKSFAYLSPYATLIIGLSALFGGINLVMMMFSPARASSQIDSAAGIISLVTNIVFVIGYFGVSSRVTRIRMTFVASARYQKYMEAMNKMGNQGFTQNSGAFGPGFGGTGFAAGASQTKTSNFNGSSPNPENEMIDPQKKKLNSMSIADLRKVAEKLSISGYETMKKPELVEAIWKVTQK